MTAARDLVAAHETEDDFMAAVLDFAQFHRWLKAHFRPSATAQGWRTAVQGDGKGFPDLVLVRDHRIIFAELKSRRGKLSDDQKIWLDALSTAAARTGIEVYVWRPEDWDELVRILGQ